MTSAAFVKSNTVFQEPSRRFEADRANIHTLHIQNQAIRLPGRWSNWNQEVSNRLDHLVALPIGWDGYGGRPVIFSLAYFALSLLHHVCSDDSDAPSIVPGGDGTLQLEWHQNGYDVELDILAANNVSAMRYNIETDETEEILLDNNFEIIRKWIQELR